MSKHLVSCGLMILALAHSHSASASERPGFYVGAGIGEGTLEIDDIGFDDSDTAFKLFLGYTANEYLAVELAYFDAGKPSQLGMVDTGFDLTPGTLEIETTGVNLSGVGTLPLTGRLSLFGKLGVASIRTDSTVRFGRFSDSDRQTDEEISYGGGLIYAVNESFQLRAEYEGFDIDAVDLSQATISAVFKF